MTLAAPASPAPPHESRAAEGRRFRHVTDLLGGKRILRRQPQSRLDAHEIIVKGLPGASLRHLVDHVPVLREPHCLERATGMSVRTFQRHKDAPAKPLSQEQSGRIWNFATILARATAVFGSQRAAEEWLVRPAMGLEQRRPIDLLASPEGRDLVEEFLERLEYGVYT